MHCPRKLMFVLGAATKAAETAEWAVSIVAFAPADPVQDGLPRPVPVSDPHPRADARLARVGELVPQWGTATNR